MILNFISPDSFLKELLNDCYNNMQQEYSDLQEYYTYKKKSELDILNSIYSRSILESDLVINLTIISVLDYLKTKQIKIDEITIQNYYLYKLIKKDIYYSDVKINYSVLTRLKSLKIYNNIYSAIYLIFRCIPFIVNSLIARDKKRALKNKSDLVILDTYITNYMLVENKFNDRYYSGIDEFIDYDLNKDLYYLPTLPLKFNKKSLNRIFNNTQLKLIYKYDYLSFFDYLISLIKCFKNLNFNKKIKFKGYNIYPLLKSEFSKNRFKHYRSLLDFYFIKSFSKKNKIKTFILWHENRSKCKAFTIAIKKFQKDSNLKGYQGFHSSSNYHFYICPSNYEIKSNAIPDKILVIGNKLKKRLLKFSNSINIELAPAFRQSNKIINKIINKNFNIIILLSSDNKCIDDVFELLFNLDYKVLKKLNVNFIIKPHPISNFNKIEISFGHLLKLYNNYNLVQNTPIDELIEYTNAVISIKTGSVIEFITNGIPSIIVEDSSLIFENPIPDGFNQDLWKVVRNSNELQKAIVEFNKTKINYIDSIYEDYNFTPNHQNVKKFLS